MQGESRQVWGLGESLHGGSVPTRQELEWIPQHPKTWVWNRLSKGNFKASISKRKKWCECFPLSQGCQGLCAVPNTLSVWVQVKSFCTSLPLLFGGKPKPHVDRGNDLIGTLCSQAVWIWLPAALSLQTLGSMGCHHKEGNLQSSGRLSLHVGPSAGKKKSRWFLPEAQRELLSFFFAKSHITPIHLYSRCISSSVQIM